ncbi:hypothetical protein [Acidipropionibacterium acidipropionici]|uniref:hypothetical protein n=1 Tax=Acidipropionibacterium acidipropionici TaxID=1748 RepID=UPI0004208D37|nr:hypothetical protein [Acidipropionibacterium acidipropionici]ALN15119.1 hypothetical protein ASQ49_07365 [Acidipropionibacterium acidipropionici]APZ09127.1 hypothetical protein BWX38_07555 [Acidipropionibacterium acidipropionici]
MDPAASRMNTVATQAGLEAAVAAGGSFHTAAGGPVIHVDSPADVDLWLPRRGVSLFDGGAMIHVHGRSRIVLSDGTAVAHDEATVTCGPDAAHDSRVRAGGLAQVRLRDDAMCLVRGMAPDGGVRVTTADAVWDAEEGRVYSASGDISSLTDPYTWCRMFHVATAGGVATVFKAVDAFWTTARAAQAGVFYRPGTMPQAPDWVDDDAAGGGLHFSPTPFQAREVVRSCAHVVACGVLIAELRPVSDDVCKAPRVVRGCEVVDS